MELHSIDATKHIETTSNGAVKGVVLPCDADSSLFLIEDSETLGAAQVEADGSFCMDGVGEGTYVLLIMPNTSYCYKEVLAVQITQNGTTDLGFITLQRSNQP